MLPKRPISPPVSGPRINRRSFFQSVGGGLHGAALTYLFQRDLFGDSDLPGHGGGPATPNLKPKTRHHEPKARSVIHLFMNGGPSQMDLFDPKEALNRHHGQAYFNKIAGEVESPGSAGALMRSPFKFQQHGQSGTWVSELMPHLARQVDDIALIRSMHTTILTHEPAIYKIQTGRMLPGYPSLGSWVVYGLGSENQSLPAYVVLDDPLGLPVNGVENWQSGFLPPVYQGMRFRASGSPLLNLQPEAAQPPDIVELERELLARLDRSHARARPDNPSLEARISAYQLAARMQLEATDALDLSRESPETLESYGLNDPRTESYGRRCLIARRLVERGVRFVQLYINGQIWDNHGNIAADLRVACERTDKPVAALLRDLKQRGLIESTLVIWGGEFGRLPIAQMAGDLDEKKAGRDHNKNAMVTWMAGAGIKRGITYGSTDEIGLAAVEQRMSVEDWHATILHLLGLNHEHVFFERLGLKERITSVFEPRIVREILS
jgi:hypothetical protein